MKRLLSITTAFTAAIAISAFSVVSHAAAIGTISDGANSARGVQQPIDLFGNAGVFSEISNVLLFVVGAIAVIMIVIGGLRYVISGGDSTQVTAAKNTIMYALIGIIIAILAYAAVNFVVNSFVPSGTNADGSTGQSSYGASTR